MYLQPQPEALDNLNAISITLSAIAPIVVVIAILTVAAAAYCLYCLCRNETRLAARRRTRPNPDAAAVYSFSAARRRVARKPYSA